MTENFINAGVLYHIMARGNNGQRIFLKSGDYEAFLEVLVNVRGRYPFDLYATSFSLRSRGHSDGPHQEWGGVSGLALLTYLQFR
jgi:hypothetical protein